MFYILKKLNEEPKYYKNQKHIQRAKNLTDSEYQQMNRHIRKFWRWEHEEFIVEPVYFEKA